MRFELKKEHLMLLGNAYVEWCDAEAGAPAIHCKRPYGNSGHVTDVLEIIGDDENRCPHCDEVLDDAVTERAEKLHRETEHALAVVLSCVGRGVMVVPGVYQRPDGYGRANGWVLVEGVE